jgi:hypothetical protein
MGALLACGAAAGLSPGRAAAQTPDLLRAVAREHLDRFGRVVQAADVVGIVDFSRPSSEPRLHLLDMRSGAVESLLVAHGRGSDPEHSGWLQRFSNDFGSFASCKGAFLTSSYYVGKHGRSMRVIGLEPTNSNALARDIVVHAADYVSPLVLRDTGKLGRSEGCFALDARDLPIVLDRLGPGRLLVSTKLT